MVFRTITRALSIGLAICSLLAPAALAAEGKGRIELAYVEWSCATASTNVVKAVLQEKLGYEVELTAVSAAAMWQALATGDVDAMTTAWLPTTHKHYYEKLKDQVVNLGHNLEGTRIGIVVPAYVTIDSIEAMNAQADRFDRQIIGIDPGAGIMMKTETVMDAYGLDAMTLMEGSGAMMTAVLKSRMKQSQWVAVTGWTPHWKFGRWDLKYLDDPKGIYGSTEHIDTVVRKGLDNDYPEVYKFLDRFEWSAEDIQTVMDWNQEKGADPYQNAVRWIRQHPVKVAAWLEDN